MTAQPDHGRAHRTASRLVSPTHATVSPRTSKREYNLARCYLDLEARLNPTTTCWLCGGTEPPVGTTIKTNCETPGGKKCRTKEVKVHFGCFMDMEP